jgi:hypothetical protein
MKTERYPRCSSCGQWHAWLGTCPKEPENWLRPKPAVLWATLSILLLCWLVGTCHGAVILTSYGPTGKTLDYTATTHPGTYAFQLHPDSAGPEFALALLLRLRRRRSR